MSGYVRRYSTADSGDCQYAEAAINTLRAMSRCMLNKTHLVKQKFWFLALAAAAYTYNHIGRDAFKGKSPLERLLQRPVSLKQLLVFGSPCAVHVPMSLRCVGAKLKDASVVGYIVGAIRLCTIRLCTTGTRYGYPPAITFSHAPAYT
jgi:hypothetical protein